MSEIPKSDAFVAPLEGDEAKFEQLSAASEATTSPDSHDRIVRLGRVSAFGPSLDGGFGTLD